MPRKSRPEPPPRLPIALGPTSNGEYVPRPESALLRRVAREALARASEHARAKGLARRDFLASACGAATVLSALSLTGCRGGRYAVSREHELDQDAARAVLDGDELVFDVQTHHVAADRPWYETSEPSLASFLRDLPSSDCGRERWVECYARDPYIKEVFLDSDTRLACLSALWGGHDHNPLHADEAARTRDRLAELGRPRLRIHGIVEPRAEGYGPLQEYMAGLAGEWGVAAWKLYPVWGPEGTGYLLTERLGRRVIEIGLSLGVPLFAVHKGLPLPGMDPSYTSPADVGPAAREHPDATFLVYHSGYEPDRTEGPYDPTATRGVDALIASCERAGIGPDGNVYAELGSLWREVMTRPDEAAHALGKLLAHLGPDRVLWGTDAIWYGSPQDQLRAFRAFEIAPELQERHGYPALTPEVKRKVLGLNALRVYGVAADELRESLADDRLERARSAYAAAPSPSFTTYGPRTRRELARLLALQGGPGHG